MPSLPQLMKTSLLILIVSITCLLTATAQSSMRPHISAGIEYGLTTGSLADSYGSVIGASVKFELPVASPGLAITATAGISEFLVRLDYDGPVKLDPDNFIPVNLGIKYYFSGIGYIEADGGLSQNIQNNFIGRSSAFIYSPIIGFSAPTNKHTGTIDLGLRYESRIGGAGNINQVALRLAYRFGPTAPAQR